MRSLDEDLQAAVAFHGHLCMGMVLGVRMARLGMQILGIDDPLNFRDLIVYVEMDRCATDAVSVATGCTLGRRRLKVIDYGKMAATFVNLATNEAIRVAPKLVVYPQPGEDPVVFLQGFKDEELFMWKKVLMSIPREDLPGKPLHNVVCEKCGEVVLDCREVMVDNKTFCKACVNKPYYQEVSEGRNTYVGDLRPVD